jgi:hypothetical protein
MTLQEFEQILLGGSGSQIVDDTGARTQLKIKSIDVLTDTVFAVATGLDGAGNAIDYKNDTTNWNWVNVPAGTTLFAGIGNFIDKVQLTSGKVKFNKGV